VTGQVPGVEPVDVDRVLVVTFTEAAALQMRERIARAVRGKLDELERLGQEAAAGSGPDPAAGDGLVAHLRRQAALLGRASISTLHSFCHSVCRRYFHRLGLDPAFEVISDEEATLLRSEVLDEVFESLYERADPGFLALVEAYGDERGDDRLRETILRLHDFSRSHPDPDGWLERAAAAFEPDPEEPFVQSAFGRSIVKDVEITLLELADRLHLAERLARAPGGPAAYAPVLADDAARLKVALQACRAGFTRWDDVTAAIGQAAEFERLPPVRTAGAPDPERAERLKQTVQDARNTVKRSLTSLAGTLSTRTEETIATELRALAAPMQALARLVTLFDSEYGQAKDERAMVDFSDLEHLCLRVLTAGEAALDGREPGRPDRTRRLPSDAALELRERFHEVLVDEYQDTNGVQEAILQLVSRGDNLFMVGDVKQSIYRFRLADPQLFMEKAACPERGGYIPVTPGEPPPPASSGCPGRRVTLRSNFRSRRPVLDGVNYIFRRLMRDAAQMEIDYNEEAELVYGAGEAYGPAGEEGPAVELHLVEHASPGREQAGRAAPGEDGAGGQPQPESGSASEPGSEPDFEHLHAVEREAHVIARRIREIVGSELVYDSRLESGARRRGGYRKARYRDIVILMRATTGLANQVLEVLRQHDIPAHAQLSTGYFTASEVETVLSLLRLIDNPRQDIPLAAVLRSPIVGLDEADLARVRLARREGDYYGAVLAAAGLAREESDGNLQGRLRRFLERLDDWRTAARRGPLSALVWRLLSETGFYAYVGGLRGGRQRQANLRTLHDRARQFDQFSRQGLARFLRFIDQLRESEGDLGPPPALGENEDVVRVMSVHRSKGLEFPIVFVANLGRQFNLSDARGDLLCHRELGFGPTVVDAGRRLKYPSVAHWAVAKACERNTRAEELRILYVAMTRARDHLILVGGQRNLQRSLTGWCLAGPGEEEEVEGVSPVRVAGARTFLDWIVPALASHPHAAVLREMAGAEGTPPGGGDASTWSIRLWGPDGVPGLEPIPQPGPDGRAQPAEGSHVEVWENVARREPVPRVGRSDITAALEWTYPHRRLTELPAKVAPTEMKRLREPWHAEEAEPIGGAGVLAGPGPAAGPASGPAAGRAAGAGPAADSAVGGFRALKPAFLQTGPPGVAPTERGQATHLLLQHVDLGGPFDEESLARAAEKLVEREIMTPRQAESVDVAGVARFFESDLGRWLVDAKDRVRREMPFTLALPAEEVFPDLAREAALPPTAGAAGETVFVQGIIDALIVEPDGLTVIDFKTDRVSAGEVPARAEFYRHQVDLYRQAVEEAWNRPVKDVWLYFLTPGRAVRVP